MGTYEMRCGDFGAYEVRCGDCGAELDIKVIEERKYLGEDYTIITPESCSSCIDRAFEDGRAEGHAEGYEDGEKAGDHKGYDRGYSQGYENGGHNDED